MALTTRPTDRRPSPSVRAVGPPRALVLLFVVLALYAAFGKGFAYAGVPPLFVGEAVLVVVMLSVVGSSMAVPRSAAAALTAALGGLVVVQLAVDLLARDDPAVETLRGIAPVSYSLYAFAIYGLLRTFERRRGRAAVIDAVDDAMARATPLILPVVVVLAALLLTEPTWLPTWPSSGVSMLISKSGDIAVTLVLVAPFLSAARPFERRTARLAASYGLWAATALLVIGRSRGAVLALAAGILIIRPRAVRVVKGVLVAATVVLLLYVSGIAVEVRGRELSYDAVGDAAGSLVGTQPEDQIGSNYVGTASWRADWWDDIWQDVTDDRMLLHGHGWGDNLAVRYGIVPRSAAEEATVLRLPHNIFFSLAGRAGVLVAVGYLLVPVLTVVRTFRHRSTDGATRAVGGARGAVVAALVIGFVDVYLESPQGAILLWSLIGYLWWATAPRLDRVVASAPRESAERGK